MVVRFLFKTEKVRNSFSLLVLRVPSLSGRVIVIVRVKSRVWVPFLKNVFSCASIQLIGELIYLTEEAFNLLLFLLSFGITETRKFSCNDDVSNHFQGNLLYREESFSRKFTIAEMRSRFLSSRSTIFIMRSEHSEEC